MVLQSYCTDCHEELKSNYGVDVDWEEILEIILTLIEDCFEDEESFLQGAKNPNVFQKVALRVKVRKLLGGRRRRARKVADCLLNCASEYSDEDCCTAYNEGREVFGG
jgi:hypothetical protein